MTLEIRIPQSDRHDSSPPPSRPMYTATMDYCSPVGRPDGCDELQPPHLSALIQCREVRVVEDVCAGHAEGRSLPGHWPWFIMLRHSVKATRCLAFMPWKLLLVNESAIGGGWGGGGAGRGESLHGWCGFVVSSDLMTAKKPHRAGDSCCLMINGDRKKK